MSFSMKTITVKIDGMHCTSCPIMIDGKLEDDVDGIASARTNYVKQECVVDFDDTVVTSDVIIQAIKDIGYAAYLDKK